MYIYKQMYTYVSYLYKNTLSIGVVKGFFVAGAAMLPLTWIYRGDKERLEKKKSKTR